MTGIAQNADTGDLYAATDFGVLRLPPAATDWVQAGRPAAVAVYGLTLAQAPTCSTRPRTAAAPTR